MYTGELWPDRKNENFNVYVFIETRVWAKYIFGLPLN